MKKTDSKIVNFYHRLLVWEITDNPLLTRILEAIAAPLMGKSVVLYFDKQGANS